MIEKEKDKYIVIRRPVVGNKDIFRNNEFYVIKRSRIIEEIEIF